MTRRLARAGVLLALLPLASVSLAGQGQQGQQGQPAGSGTKPWTGPRTAWGDPDLQGIWRGSGGTPLERALAVGDQEFITLSDAEVEKRVKEAEARRQLQAEGKVENRGFRLTPNYNAIWDYSDGEVRVARRVRTSAIVDPPNGRLPAWTPEQVKYWEAREAATRGHGETDTVDDMNLNLRCISNASTGAVTNWGLAFGGASSSGIGRSEFPAEDVNENDGLGLGASPGPVRRILQSPGYVAFVLGDSTAYRVVSLDGRPAPGPRIRQWMGVSRGRWEGQTLVVETTNISFGSPVIPNYGGSMYPGSGETLRIIERFTRTGVNTMDYRYTIDDPGVYTRPYTVQHDLGRSDAEDLATSICQEDTKTKANILTNARADEWNSLQAGEDSVDARVPRVEQLKKEAMAEAERSTQAPR